MTPLATAADAIGIGLLFLFFLWIAFLLLLDP
jgi:hypothetical protein